MVEHHTSSERETVDIYNILVLLDAGASLVSNVLSVASQALSLVLSFV